MSDSIHQSPVQRLDTYEDFFRISVDQPAAGRCGTWGITFTDPVIFSRSRLLFPNNFGTDEFVSYSPAFKLIGSFIFHRKTRSLWITGNPIFSDGIVKTFKMCPGVQRNISFLEMPTGSRGIIEKKFLIQADGIKSFASWTDLSSSGELNFLSMVISGCLSKKALL